MEVTTSLLFQIHTICITILQFDGSSSRFWRVKLFFKFVGIMEFVIKVFLKKECKLEKIRTRVHIANFLKESILWNSCLLYFVLLHPPPTPPPPLFTRRVGEYGELGSVSQMPTVLDNFYFHKMPEQSLPAVRHAS